MVNILISGYYGNLNIGDEAILGIIVKKLREIEVELKEDFNITVLSSRPDLTKKTYNVNSINRKSFYKVVKAIKKCDILISGGGTLFQNETSNRSLYYYLFQIFIAKLFGKKIIVLSQGVGPIKKKLNWIIFKKIINHVDKITLRDYDSYNLLKEANIKKDIVLAADPAFLLEECTEEKINYILQNEGIKDISSCIGVAIRGWKNENDMTQKLAVLLDDIIDKLNYKIVFIPFQGKWDKKKSIEIAQYMKNTPYILNDIYTPQEVLGIIKKLKAIIGIRLHSLIFAAKVNTEFIGISYDPKIDSFLKMYGKLASSQIDNLDTEAIFNQIKKLKNINYKDTTELLIKRAEKPFIVLKEMLSQMKKKRSIFIYGVRIDVVDFEIALKRFNEFLNDHLSHVIFTPNVEMVMLAQKDIEFKEVLNSSHLNLPDGIGVVWASKFFGEKIYERVAGFDFMQKILPIIEEKKLNVYLLGAKEGVANKAKINLINKFNNLKIVGVHNGYFTDAENQKIIEDINQKDTDVLFVALGMKKQEEWIIKNKDKIRAKIIMGVGGSFDVLAGEVKRAPYIFQKLGLEWFYRLIQEPWRYKRMMVLPIFVINVLTDKIFGGKRIEKKDN